jgi:hypothetical protein
MPTGSYYTAAEIVWIRHQLQAGTPHKQIAHQLKRSTVSISKVIQRRRLGNPNRTKYLVARRNITVSLSGAMFDALDARARAENTPKTTWVRDLIKRSLEA